MPAGKDLAALLHSVKVAAQLTGETWHGSGFNEKVGLIQCAGDEPLWDCAAPISMVIKHLSLQPASSTGLV